VSRSGRGVDAVLIREGVVHCGLCREGVEKYI